MHENLVKDLDKPSAAYAGPVLSGVTSTSNSGVRVTFSEEVDQASAENAANYSIPGLTVMSATRDIADFTIVNLVTTPQSAIGYTLTVSNVMNLAVTQAGAPDSGNFTGTPAPCALTLSSASSTSNTTVRLTFSADVDITTAETSASYSIPGLTVSAAARDIVDFKIVDLTTSSQSSINFDVTASGVKCTTGELIGLPDTQTFLGTDPPCSLSLSGASSTSNTTVRLTFSADVDQVTAENKANYSIPGLTVSAAARDIVDFKIVNLTTSSQSGVNFDVTASGVKCISGELIGLPDTATFLGTAPPCSLSLSGASSTSNTTVQLTFSADVDQVTAEAPGNYAIVGLTVSAAARDIADFKIVDLTTATQSDVNYTVTASSVKCISGELIGAPDSAGFTGDVAPAIKSVSSSSKTSVIVYYNEPVDQTTAETKGNYVLTPAINVLSATRDATDNSKVVITTQNQTGGTEYKLSVGNVKDLTNNVISPSPSDGYFTGTGAPDTTAPFVISASMFDASTAEVLFSEAMDLATSQTKGNYSIKDSSGTAATITAAVRQADTSRVRLTISGTFTDHLYSLTVSTAVKDVALNALQASPANQAAFAGTGTMPEYLTDGPVIVDPMKEGANPYTLMMYYRGRVYIGPSSADNSMFRIRADGSDPEIVTFKFHGPSSTTTSLNPGPDAEDGIDYFTGGVIGGTEYLFLGPSKSGGGLAYIYYTTDNGLNLNFYYIDTTAITAGQTRGVSSMTIFFNRLYIGFPGSGGKRPWLLKLLNIIPWPTADIDIFELEADNMPLLGDGNAASLVGIDVMQVFNDRLYFANGGNAGVTENGGIIKSTTNDPFDYVNNPGDWQDITPTANAAWHNSPTINRFSVELTAPNQITPDRRAFPAMAVFNNKLYAIRNTTGGAGGPQIWKYDGASWSIVAASSGICNMGSANNTEISMLVVNGDRLYVGYDNVTNGVRVFRTKSGITDPSVAADFEQVGTNGLGDPSGNYNIYSSLSASHNGVDYLWIMSGRTSINQRLYRTKN